MADNKSVDNRISIDAHVWNLLMDNEYDCVFTLDILSERVEFIYLRDGDREGAFSGQNEATDLNGSSGSYQAFLGRMLEYVVEEEHEPFEEQMKTDYLCREIDEKGCFVRTIHFVVGSERRAKAVRIYRHDGNQDMLIGYMFDISAALDHDWMTDEYARLGFIENAERLLNKLPTEDEGYSLVYTNIKGFKAINDLFGEQSGDMVIFQTRDILRTMLKPIIMGRLENDHFVLITKDEYLRETVLSSLSSQTYSEGFKQYDFTIRCGIYRIHDRDVSVGKMVDRAKLAEKSIGDDVGHSYVIFNDEVRVNYVKQRVLISDMKKAMELNEFKPYYQAIVAADTAQIVSAEALVRWQHGKLGMISPGEFIPAFEGGGQITLLDKYMIDCILDFNTRRARECKLTVPCAVNLSRIDFYNTALMEHLTELYESNPFATDYVRIEVTESAYADLEKNASDYLNRLKSLGVKILLDDYGSGMSSLSTLENFEFDIVKLDMGFIRKIGIQDKAEIIIRSTIELSHALGATVTAEGVETAEQLGFLRDAGCDYIQGYYFYKPVPEEEFESLLG